MRVGTGPEAKSVQIKPASMVLPSADSSAIRTPSMVNQQRKERLELMWKNSVWCVEAVDISDNCPANCTDVSRLRRWEARANSRRGPIALSSTISAGSRSSAISNCGC